MNPTGAVPFGSGPADALHRAFADGSLIVATYDPEDVLRYASAAFKRAFKLDAVEGTMTFADLIVRAVGNGVGPIINCEDARIFIAETQRRRRGQPGERFFATDMVDGSWYWMTETLLDDGWLVLVGSEISPLKENERSLVRAHERALHEAKTDALTGLPNRRQVLDYLDTAIVTMSARETPIAIALFDLDRFKHINDEHGHLAGDAVLCDFASLARSLVRRSDVIGRIGGEEFLLVMPGTTAAQALRVVERVRHGALGRIVLCLAGKEVRYSVSAGITQVSRWDRLDDSFYRADRALYKAKRLGRNRVLVEL
ncbi:GGDEF domain-containing protein [Paraburkholderia fungorum]|uniref:GGDEF domain-containing protein n=1 Tax=Paraburkholderia fungorum TaxID=134537 RepID=UPI001C1EC9A7|nr:GGDEF domain-containing protein [Paraburkholderia fungorum]MBU7443473.1 GGDEF domain-containing protein [Paraburkholderia fungorum]